MENFAGGCIKEPLALLGLHETRLNHRVADCAGAKARGVLKNSVYAFRFPRATVKFCGLTKSGGLFFYSIFEFDPGQYIRNSFRSIESLKSSLGTLAKLEDHRQTRLATAIIARLVVP